MDEAGTSKLEPVTVVVGVIIHADRDWMRAQRLVTALYDKYVPAELRPNFVFHAKDVLNGYRNHKNWTVSDRVSFIGAMAAVPQTLRAAISMAIYRRDFNYPLVSGARMNSWDLEHLLAFRRCLCRADKYVRDWAKLDEVATVVAEDVPEKRKFFKKTLRLQLPNRPFDEKLVVQTVAEKKAVKIFQTSAGPIERIIDTVHFVDKADAPLIPIADACAFSFRRYFAQQANGENLVASMLGTSLDWDDWQGLESNSTFSFNPRHQYSTPERPVYRL